MKEEPLFKKVVCYECTWCNELYRSKKDAIGCCPYPFKKIRGVKK